MKFNVFERKKYWIFLLFFVLTSLIFAVWFSFEGVFSPIVPPIAKVNEKQNNKPVVASFNKKKYSNTDPTSIWVVINKQHPITPINYTPSDLVNTNGALISSKSKVDFEALMFDANKQSANLNIVSSYRSYDTQSAIYGNYLSIYGQDKTDTFSARAGYSEHQTGFAVDFGSLDISSCNLEDCFSETTGGLWLANYAMDYGFIMRYTSDKQSITGYKYEPWHYRYIGKELAAELKKQSVKTLEEFFKISGGETYI